MKRPSFPFVLRFRLQTLLVLMTAFAVVLGLVFQELNRERGRKRMIADIQQLGGHVRLVNPRQMDNKASGIVNGWLRIFLGDDYFTAVADVALKPRSAEDVDWLQAFPEMTHLWLDGTSVTDDVLSRLKGLAQLRDLTLIDAILSERGLESLAELPNLERLEVKDCALSEESLKSLARATEHSKLRGISFTGGGLTDADLQALHGAQSSVSLMFDNTNVTEAGMLALRAANPAWTIHFRNQFAGSRAQYQNDLPSMQGIAQTEKLVYEGPLTSGATLAILTDARKLSTLELIKCPLTDADLEHLQPLQNLQSLSIRDIPITDESLHWLGGLKKLRTINLNRTKIEGTGAGALPPGIKDLNLMSTEVTDQGVAGIAKLNSLESLSLGGDRITDAAIDDFAKMTSLRRLSLSETAISPSGAARLRKALPNCVIFFH